MGFAKDADYNDTRKKLIDSFDVQYNKYERGRSNIRPGKTLVYIIIAMIQLRNGSRISEGVCAFQEFMVNGYDDKVNVRIAKSGQIRNGIRSKKNSDRLYFLCNG